MTVSPYLHLVPRSLDEARTGKRPEFAPSRLAPVETPTERIRTDRRYRDLERTKVATSWTNVIVEGLAWAFVMGAIIILTHL